MGVVLFLLLHHLNDRNLNGTGRKSVNPDIVCNRVRLTMLMLYDWSAIIVISHENTV